jgi:hypothetical protein
VRPCVSAANLIAVRSLGRREPTSGVAAAANDHLPPGVQPAGQRHAKAELQDIPVLAALEDEDLVSPALEPALDNRQRPPAAVLSRRMALRWVLFDWGNTLMLEEGGPADVPMARWPDVRAVDDAAAVLAEVSSRYRVAVATNAAVSDRPMIERALARVSLADFVSEVFCYRDLGARKAEPGFWSAVVSRLGVPRDALLMIGDDLAQDVWGPRRCGIAAIWFNRRGAQVPPGLDAPVIETLAQLPGVIERLVGSASKLAPPAAKGTSPS